ncbi:MAG: polysaccharide deacetylase [Lachnospiraceae bacterium]|nr:polysaccharide deacetylase [Lachnospiraceae bacterium]
MKKFAKKVLCLTILFVLLSVIIITKEEKIISTLNPHLNNEFSAPQREVLVLSEEEKICYLTFDDGPSKNTIKILDLLKQYNAKATFFVIGNSICEENRPIIERIIQEGHAIGLHAYNHVYEKFYATENSYLEDYETLYKVLKEDYGVETALFRFPGGSACKYLYGNGKEYVKKMQEKGFACFDWNVTGEDSVGTPTVSSIQKNVFERVFSYHTPIVLLHDSSIADITVEALPGILEKVKENGYKFDTLEHRKEYVFSGSK